MCKDTFEEMLWSLCGVVKMLGVKKKKAGNRWSCNREEEEACVDLGKNEPKIKKRNYWGSKRIVEIGKQKKKR